MRRVFARLAGVLARRWRRTPFVFGLVAALVLGLGAGSAFAYFTSTGSGSGAATVGHVTGVTVLKSTGTASPKLQPGASGDLKLTITNPNHFTVTVVHIKQAPGTIGVSGAKGACTGATSGVSVPTETISYSVGAGGTYTITIATGAHLGTTSPTGCQGATFSIPVTITVEQR